MIQIGACFRHHSLFTIIGLVALAQNAIAEDGTSARPARAVESVVTVSEESLAGIERPLPLTLAAWEAERDENDLAEAHSISLEFLPQGRLSSRPPFIDFSQWEIGGFIGAVHYSSDFKAKLDWTVGLTTRVPVTGLGRLGLFAQIWAAYIDRDLPFFYNKQAGTWYGAAIGADYTLWKGELGYIRPQVAVMYAYWHNVNGLDNGIGILVGLQVGLFWIKNYDKTSVTFTPQIQFNGGDHMIFLPLGISVDF
jgi:hypothetical protein